MTNFIIFMFLILATPVHNFVINTKKLVDSGSEQIRSVYQVGIIGDRNNSVVSILVCSGAIISEKLVLTAAECFVYNDGFLKEYKFSIITDKINWTLPGGIKVPIDLIYLTGDGKYFLNNIAVAKLSDNLGISNNTRLIALDVPAYRESFLKDEGVLSGYGYKWVATLTGVLRGQWQRNTEGINYLLKKLDVLVVDNTLCSARYGEIDDDKQMCGLILPDQVGYSWNICKNGAGSPLVIRNKIVGLATQIYSECDDSIFGTIYTNVSTFAPFINSIINGNPLPGTFIHHNRIQMTYMTAAAT